MPAVTIDLTEECAEIATRVGPFAIGALTFDPGGRRIAIGLPGRVLVHDRTTAERVVELTAGDAADESRRPARISFTRDGARIVVEWCDTRGGENERERALDVYAADSGRHHFRVDPAQAWAREAPGTPRSPATPRPPPRPCAWSTSDDGALLAAAWNEPAQRAPDAVARLGIWDLHTGALIPPPRGAAPLAGTIRDVAFATYWNRQTLFCLVLERFGYATHEISLETGKLASLASRVSVDEVRELVLAPDACRILVVAESELGLIDRVRGTHQPIALPCMPVPTRVAVEWLERSLRVYWLQRDAAGATATLVRQEIVRVPTTTVVARGALSAAALSPTGARWALAEGPLVRLPERFELESLDDAPARPRARRR